MTDRPDQVLRGSPKVRRSAAFRVLARAIPTACTLCTLAACWRSPPLDHTNPLEVTRVLGEVGTAPGQFAYPRAMDFDGRFLWVVDKSARVQRIDPTSGRCAGGWIMPEYILGKPTGITVAPGENAEQLVYIPDTHYHRVVIYRPPAIPPEGTPSRQLFLPAQPPVVTQFGEYGEGPGQFIYPTDVAVLLDDSGKKVRRLYVTEYGGNDRVNLYEPDGAGGYRFASSFGHFGTSSSPDQIEFNRPQSIAIDSPGVSGAPELIVTDACNHRVGRFTLDGKLLAWIGSPESVGEGPGQFKYPYGLCLLGDHTAVIAEFGNNRIQHIDLRTGKGLGSFGGPGRLPGQLINPWAVTVVGRDVFVLDSQNNRVVVASVPGVRSLAHALDVIEPSGPRLAGSTR